LRGDAGVDFAPESGGVPRERVVFDPRNIRSRHARFDPRLSGNADLLASRAAPGGLLSPEQPERLNWRDLEGLL
jgi:hypothetical protein